MSDFNEAKLETLHMVDDYVELSPSELADLEGISLHCASNRLRRYYKQGLLDRGWDPPSFNYVITEKGLGRIDYLESVSFQNTADAAQINRCEVERTSDTDDTQDFNLDESESEELDDFDEDDDDDLDEDEEQDYYEIVPEPSFLDAIKFAANNRCRVNRD